PATATSQNNPRLTISPACLPPSTSGGEPEPRVLDYFFALQGVFATYTPSGALGFHDRIRPTALLAVARNPDPSLARHLRRRAVQPASHGRRRRFPRRRRE